MGRIHSGKRKKAGLQHSLHFPKCSQEPFASLKHNSFRYSGLDYVDEVVVLWNLLFIIFFFLYLVEHMAHHISFQNFQMFVINKVVTPFHC